MKPEDVMKALECCVKVGGYRDAHYCKDCPLHEERCALLLPQNALALLREKDEEIERLQGALKAEERHNELTMGMAKKALANARADTARKMQERFAVHFGTYTGNDTVKVIDLFRLLNKFAEEEMEEGG